MLKGAKTGKGVRGVNRNSISGSCKLNLLQEVYR